MLFINVTSYRKENSDSTSVQSSGLKQQLDFLRNTME